MLLLAASFWPPAGLEGIATFNYSPELLRLWLEQYQGS
jgi:hypothetical protein